MKLKRRFHHLYQTFSVEAMLGNFTYDAFTFQVLELMKEVAEDEDDSSDISGYHSDSDSAIMMSGNSPYVSKRARYNFLSRSGKNIEHVLCIFIVFRFHVFIAPSA